MADPTEAVWFTFSNIGRCLCFSILPIGQYVSRTKNLPMNFDPKNSAVRLVF